MNAPEHFAKAESCFTTADDQGPSYEDAGLWLDLGIGHALLAIAALLAEQSSDPQWSGITRPSHQPATQDYTADEERAAFEKWGPP